jgi:hypothetical protein
MSTPEFLGTTNARRADGVISTFYVWAHICDTGQIESISYGISIHISCSHGPVLRQNCTSSLQRALLRFADASAVNVVIDDFDVIER